MQVTVMWPPKAQPASAPSPATQAAPEKPVADTFSSETLRVLASLGSSAGAGQQAGASSAAQGGEVVSGTSAKGVRLETLRHPVGVVGLQWSPAGGAAGTWP